MRARSTPSPKPTGKEPESNPTSRFPLVKRWRWRKRWLRSRSESGSGSIVGWRPRRAARVDSMIALRYEGMARRNYANTLARPALRRANVTQATRLHDNCRHHAGARHRREHGDLQHRQRTVVESAAVPQCRPACDHLDAFAGRERRAGLAIAGTVLLAQNRKQRF